MEHREPSRTVANDPPRRSAAAAPPLALHGPPTGSESPRGMEIDRRRAAISAIAVGAAGLFVYLAGAARRAAHAWLAGQPAYQLPFTAIELVEPPPRWFRGGPARFLEEVRRASRVPEKIALLRLKPGELEDAFKLSPWTEKVLRVSYRPRGLAVHLAYHRPVALVEVSVAEKYLIDESTIILPLHDLDCEPGEFADRERLIRIRGKGLAGPRDATPGLEWKCRPGVLEIAPGNGRIPAAANLARFLATKLASIDLSSQRALKFFYVNPMDNESRGLFLWNDDEKVYVLWGEAPGQEKPGDLDAEDKWRRLYAWSATEKQRGLPDGHYWEIVREGLVPSGEDRHPPGSAQRGRDRRDSEAILTRGSGHGGGTMSR